MPALQLTDIGWEAVLRKARTGPWIRVTEFAVAEHGVDYTPDQTQTALNGTVLFRGPIESVKTNEKNDRIFSCVVPDTSTPGSIYEIGLYLDTGELFAVGVFPTRYDKSNPFQLRVFCYLRVPQTNASVEFECVEQPIVPVYLTFASLPPANIMGPNVVIVLDGHCGGSTGYQSAPVTVCKWRNSDEWGLVSGSILYEGGASVDASGTIVTPSSAVDASYKDVAMLTVTHGAGRYQTRRVKYENGTFVVTDRTLKYAFDPTSRIAVWAGPGCCAGSC